MGHLRDVDNYTTNGPYAKSELLLKYSTHMHECILFTFTESQYFYLIFCVSFVTLTVVTHAYLYTIYVPVYCCICCTSYRYCALMIEIFNAIILPHMLYMCLYIICIQLCPGAYTKYLHTFTVFAWQLWIKFYVIINIIYLEFYEYST